tara:strand:- start:649 stop:873 length:225 start_codon:yes stop_codon:yes gene_type:complete
MRDLDQHYRMLDIEPIDYIMSNNLDFCSANIVKYASRWRFKGDPIGDLRKVVRYAEILINKHNEDLINTHEDKQ